MESGAYFVVQAGCIYVGSHLHSSQPRPERTDGFPVCNYYLPLKFRDCSGRWVQGLMRENWKPLLGELLAKMLCAARETPPIASQELIRHSQDKLASFGIDLKGGEVRILERSRIGSSQIVIGRFMLNYLKDVDGRVVPVSTEGIISGRYSDSGELRVKVVSSIIHLDMRADYSDRGIELLSVEEDQQMVHCT
jgi:hypothetical protein